MNNVDLQIYNEIKTKIDESWQGQNTSYVIVRKDLPGAQKTVQACHAVWQLVRDCGFDHPTLCILEVRDEKELKHYLELMKGTKLSYRAFREPDAPQYGAITAFAVEPIDYKLEIFDSLYFLSHR